LKGYLSYLKFQTHVCDMLANSCLTAGLVQLRRLQVIIKRP
jgi:hypothetical protein